MEPAIPEPEPEPELLPSGVVDPRALFRLCNVYGFARTAATDALRRSGDFDEALAALLSALSSGATGSALLGTGETSVEARETQREELEALAAIFENAFSRPTDLRSEIRLQREEPSLTLTLTVLATESYPKKPPLVALAADGLLAATNLCLTEVITQRALEMTLEDDESVKVFELCSWVTDELDPNLLVETREDKKSVAKPDAELDLARQVAAVAADRERQAGKYTYEVVFRDGSVGKVYASGSAMLMRPLGSKGAAHPGVDYQLGAKVEARLDHEATFERAEVVSRRAVDGGPIEQMVASESDAARRRRQQELLQHREQLQRKGKGPSRASTLELYANSRREGKAE
jgi:hypothetical protein